VEIYVYPAGKENVTLAREPRSESSALIAMF
jgi:hypothetical protein